jgi:ferredoxin
MKHLHINKQKCELCGTCIELCPDVFELKNKQIVVVSKNEAPHDWSGCVACLVNCPQKAIEFIVKKHKK